MNRQQSIKEFFQSDHSSSSVEPFDDELNEPSQEDPEVKKRGRPKAPLRWTRVFKVSRDFDQQINTFNLESDEQQFFQHYNLEEPSQDQEWSPIFWPSEFKNDQDGFRCQDYKLEEDEIMKYAKLVTKFRENFLEKSGKIEELENEQFFQEQDKQIKEPTKYRRGFTRARENKSQLQREESQSFQYHADKPKKRLLKNLSNSDQIDIAHDALVGLKSNEEIASNFNIKEASVSTLVFKLRKNNLYIKEKIEKEAHRDMVDSLIEQVTQKHLESGQHIWSASIIQLIMKEGHGLEVSTVQIRRVFKERLDMTFKRIKRIPNLGNSQRCLVMRQLYARKMINILQTEKTIWNFDESFLKDSFFVRRKWCPKDQENSIPIQCVSPRISVLFAINNHGDAYLSLSQSRTDSEKVILFFKYFFEQIDLDQPDWRENSIMLLDGASYHQSDETIEYFKKNGVPLFISAPYSYDAAPAEMWFSYFKSKDLNQEKLSTGKM